MRSDVIRLATAIVAAACLASAAQAQQGQRQAPRANPYDGRWSVQVVTEQGICDRAYRWPVIVENGRARYGGPEAFDVTGTISPKGAVRVAVARGQSGAEASGSASGKWATGTWRTFGSRVCSGTWNAEKRG